MESINTRFRSLLSILSVHLRLRVSSLLKLPFALLAGKKEIISLKIFGTVKVTQTENTVALKDREKK